MPKGTKSTKFVLQPMNGKRAVAGKWGEKKKVSNSQYKETLKKCNLENQETLESHTYLKNNIQTEEALALPKKE